MAAAYLFHIVNNHPFVDGNRGTGAGAALFFPDLNGVALDVDVDEDALADHVLAVAEGLIVKREIAEFLRTMRSA
jgi:death-on-curing protein